MYYFQILIYFILFMAGQLFQNGQTLGQFFEPLYANSKEMEKKLETYLNSSCVDFIIKFKCKPEADPFANNLSEGGPTLLHAQQVLLSSF